MARDVDWAVLLGGLGVGAGLAYLMDPNQGARRRSYLKDQAVRAAHTMGDAADTTARDLRNRTRGVIAETGARFRHEEVSDEVLVERVRSAMGRAVSHPRAIHVSAQQGHVTLSGPALERERGRLMATVSGVRGVRGVEDRLEVHGSPGDVPSLQGGYTRPGRYGMMRENWPPATRLVIGAMGACMTATGIGMLTRALTNMEMDRVTGVGAGRRGIELQKTINIAASPEEVYAYCITYENWPRFMAHVREIRSTGGIQSHWVVDGPGGIPVSWDAVVTKFVPNEVLAWKSVEGSMIEQAGIMRFDRNPDGTTRLHVRMTYNPPAGALGHAFATLMGANPKRQMDEDFNRLKSLIEEGKTSTPQEGDFTRDQIAA